MKTPRPRRTTITGARAQFASITADVLNVSSTGALVRAARAHAPGGEWPLHLELCNLPLELTARVVRCEPVPGPLSVAQGQFMLALAFVNPPARVRAMLARACREGQRSDVNTRRIRVTLSRRCPQCGSHDVAKKSQHGYSCGQCGRVFTGFRLGFMRFAR